MLHKNQNVKILEKHTDTINTKIIIQRKVNVENKDVSRGVLLPVKWYGIQKFYLKLKKH